MSEINYLAIAVAAVAALVVSSVWYGVFSVQPALVSHAQLAAEPVENNTPPWKVAVEFLRSVVVATVVGALAVQVGVDGWTAAVLLGLTAWIGFPVPILLGSVIHEGYSWRLAATHAGDWLAKLVVITVIVGVWR